MHSAETAVDAPGGRDAVAAIAHDVVWLPADLGRRDPLGWPGYPDTLAAAAAAAGASESVVTARGRVGDVEAVLIAFDFRFVGGSIGSAAGDRIVDAFTVARADRLPVVSLIASGGSRMHEGMVALQQLHRVAAQVAGARRDGIPHIAVLRNPTTGGTWASLGAGADVVLAVSGAQVGFAGRRIRQAADADHPAFTAAGQFAAGAVDAEVPADELPAALVRWLALLRPASGPPEPAEPPTGLGAAGLPADGWAAVRAARAPGRPRARTYLDTWFDSSLAISGDRCGGRDPGMLCGLGCRDGRVIAFAAQAGTKTTAAGYRTASRLIRLAERFGLPVLTLVDTPGAANDAGAEAAGLAAAIAELFETVAAATVPITSLVVGEGGSGGALALAAPGRTWITTDGYFSVIAPEAAAAILKLPPAAVPALVDQLHLRPQDLVRLGVVVGCT